MAYTIPYEEDYGIQANWPDTYEAKPYKIKPTYFVDVDGETIGKCFALIDAKEMLSHFPGGEIRIWNPTQEEYAEQLADARDLRMSNFGIMSAP
jgi:hypothetical protein